MKGVLYVATAIEYLNEAEESAKTVKNTNDLQISVITNHKLAKLLDNRSHPFDSVIEADVVFDDFRDCLFNIHLSPYNKTIFLDTDTRIIGDISDVFSILSDFDLAITNAPVYRHGDVRIPNVPSSIPQINGGVIAFSDTEIVYNYFNKVKEIYQKQIDGEILSELSNKYHDQYPLTEVLYNSKIRFAVLPREYNFRGEIIQVNSDVKIIHMRGEDVDALEQEINDRVEPRVYFRNFDRIYYADGTVNNISSSFTKSFGTNPIIKNFLKKMGLFEPVKKVYHFLNI
jgi:hypothetical protein